MAFSHPRRLRRALLPLVTSLAVALVAPVAAIGPSSAAVPPRPVTPTSESVALREVAPLAASRRADPAPEATTGSVSLDGDLHVVGVTWPAREEDRVAAVEMRERTGDTWGDWTEMEVEDDHGPDEGSEEAASARTGTDPYVTTADAVEVRLTGTDGERLPDADLDVIDPGESPADEVPTVAGAAEAAAGRPTIYTRAQWGADESIRKGSPSYGRVKAAVVHHTVNSNSYDRADVPAIIRGIYSYHVNGNGWNDIGYNFLVDRFGRVWEGRYGGIDQPVVGAHSAGVNSETYGAAVIGDFTSTQPSSAAVSAQASLAAWRLGIAHVDPTGSTTLAGKSQRTVIGHRDAFSTSCPGARLYDELGTIRSAARSQQGTMLYSPSQSTSRIAYGGSSGVTVRATPSRSVSWTVTATSVCRTSPSWRVKGTTSSRIAATWDGRTGSGTPVPPGDYVVTMTANSGTGTANRSVPVTFPVRVGEAAGAPPSWCAERLSGADRFSTAVEVAQRTDASARTVVVTSGVEASMPDALVAAPLARAKGGVLLLSGESGLTAPTRNEVARRGATTAYIVGGPAAVPNRVVTQLRNLGVRTVTRVSGSTRFATAAAVARTMGSSHAQVMIANGEDGSMADGLLLSGPASALGQPVLLVKRGAVPAATRNALRDFGTRRTVVGGGTAVVSGAVTSALPGTTRLSGSSRYGTSTAIASWSSSRLPRPEVALAGGEALVDALSGGQLGVPVLMTRPTSLPSGVRSWLRSASDKETVLVLGGSTVVSDGVAGEAQSILD